MSTEEPQEAEAESNDVADVAPESKEAASSPAAPAPSDGDSANGGPSASERQPSPPAAIEATDAAPVVQRPPVMGRLISNIHGALPDRRDGLTTEERIVFPVLLHKIVSDPETDDCIHWLACGTKFMASLNCEVGFAPFPCGMN